MWSGESQCLSAFRRDAGYQYDGRDDPAVQTLSCDICNLDRDSGIVSCMDRVEAGVDAGLCDIGIVCRTCCNRIFGLNTADEIASDEKARHDWRRPNCRDDIQRLQAPVEVGQKTSWSLW